MDKFCRWLFQPINKGSVALAHNAKGELIFYSFRLSFLLTTLFPGYDGQFILQWIHKQAQEPKIINRGLEIIQMEYCGITLLDSLNFLPMALAAFPKALGFDAAKGYFPHLFNKEENWNLVQKGLPDKRLVYSSLRIMSLFSFKFLFSYYSPDSMKPKSRQEFDAWYQQHQSDEFDFKKELEYYCHLDVDILTQGCLKFRDLLLNVSSFQLQILYRTNCYFIF